MCRRTSDQSATEELSICTPANKEKDYTSQLVLTFALDSQAPSIGWKRKKWIKKCCISLERLTHLRTVECFPKEKLEPRFKAEMNQTTNRGWNRESNRDNKQRQSFKDRCLWKTNGSEERSNETGLLPIPTPATRLR